VYPDIKVVDGQMFKRYYVQNVKKRSSLRVTIGGIARLFGALSALIMGPEVPIRNTANFYKILISNLHYQLKRSNPITGLDRP
jgi:hypothetical protein